MNPKVGAKTRQNKSTLGGGGRGRGGEKVLPRVKSALHFSNSVAQGLFPNRAFQDYYYRRCSVYKYLAQVNLRNAG